jgi:acyl phosphate:glycerol-3-phosphate acyltransferase
VRGLAAPVLAYLVGAIPTGYLVARASGAGDIRRHGSGTIGATNVLRTVGWGPAVLTLGGDVLKGYVAVAAAALLAPGDTRVTAISSIAAVAGNCWSIFLGFRGGKGVATGFGAMLRLVPWATGPAALVWVILAATFRYASLASLTSALLIPIGAGLLRYDLGTVVAPAVVAGIIVFRHRDNVARLMVGTEPRIGERRPTA